MAITYTMGGLKSVIADDIARGDLTSQIAVAIETAINTLKIKRFWFNETRTRTFLTVAAQSTYTVADDPDIPLLLEIDEMFVDDSTGSRRRLGKQEDPDYIEWLLGLGASSGRPYRWAYYDKSFVFYPIPDTVYTITPMGHVRLDAPTDDADATNVWVTIDAFEMVRAAAKAYLFQHVIRDEDQAGEMMGAAKNAEKHLISSGNRRIATGSVERTTF